MMNNLTEKQTAERVRIVREFRQHASGKLPERVVNEAVKKISTTTNSVPAKADIVSFIFYLHFDAYADDERRRFHGDAGGLSSAGGGAMFGDIYTDDIGKVYTDTVSFEFNATPVYLSILFFSADSTLLGHFEGGGVSTVAGIGGGSGNWS